MISDCYVTANRGRHICTVFMFVFLCEKISTSLNKIAWNSETFFSENFLNVFLHHWHLYIYIHFLDLKNKPKILINKRNFCVGLALQHTVPEFFIYFFFECLIFSCLKELYGLREINKSNDWAYMKANHPHREINVLICSRLLKMSHWQVKNNSQSAKWR